MSITVLFASEYFLRYCEANIFFQNILCSVEFAGVDQEARSKTLVWKMQELTHWHHVAGMDFAGVDKSAPATWCRIVNSRIVHSRKFSLPCSVV